MKTALFALLVTFCVLGTPRARADVIDLAGPWEVSLQNPKTGAVWHPTRLPGTLSDHRIGAPLALKPELSIPVLAHLQRRFSHVGPAWFKRRVEIPPARGGRAITLELERVLWESCVFVDGREIDRADSLCTPHRRDLSAALTPGRHELILRIDNREIHPDVRPVARQLRASLLHYAASADFAPQPVVPSEALRAWIVTPAN